MKKIVLASQSPRRKEILENVNVDFEIMPSHIEEIIHEKDDPKAAVLALAFEKAWDVAEKINQDQVVIGSDTVVYLDTIMGKPKDDQEALDMLKSLNGKSHQVYTGICMINPVTGIKIVDLVETQVTFKHNSLETLKSYVATGECRGKAGAYGIQGFGGLLVESIQGDYLNVVGLPISRLSDLLARHFNINIL